MGHSQQLFLLNSQLSISISMQNLDILHNEDITEVANIDINSFMKRGYKGIALIKIATEISFTM